MIFEFSEISYMLSGDELCALISMSGTETEKKYLFPLSFSDTNSVERGLKSLEERGKLIREGEKVFADKVLLFFGHCITKSTRGVAIYGGAVQCLGVFLANRAALCACDDGSQWILTPFQSHADAIEFVHTRFTKKKGMYDGEMVIYENMSEIARIPLTGMYSNRVFTVIKNWLSEGRLPGN